MGFEGWEALICTGRGRESYSSRNGVDTGPVVYLGRGDPRVQLHRGDYSQGTRHQNHVSASWLGALGKRCPPGLAQSRRRWHGE